MAFDLGNVGGTVNGVASSLTLPGALVAGGNITLRNSGLPGATYLLDKTATAGAGFSLITGNGIENVTFNGMITANALLSLQTGAGADVVTITATSGLTSKQSDVTLDLGAADGVTDTLNVTGDIDAFNSFILTDTGLGVSAVTMQAISLQTGRGGVAVMLSAGADTMTLTDVALSTTGDMVVNTADGADTF
eukprot:gene17498-21408_t